MMNYCIVNISDLDNVIWSEVAESKDTVRYNVAKDKFFVKYQGSKPSFLNSYSPYTKDEILAIIDNEVNGWFVPTEDW